MVQFVRGERREDFRSKYHWNGKERSITGPVQNVTFTGKSDFGDIKLTSGDLKKLSLSPTPVSIAKKDEKPYFTRDWQRTGLSFGATITFRDGSELKVSNVKRRFSYYSTEGYIIGGSYRYSKDDNIMFIRGSSVATVQFDLVKTIEMSDNGELTVTLRDGKQATGKRSEMKDERIDGFEAFAEDGKFSIDAKLVKMIDFGLLHLMPHSHNT